MKSGQLKEGNRIQYRRRLIMRNKKIICACLAFITAVVILFPGSDISVSYAAAAPASVYEFNHTKTAVSQLEDLFTTIDLMDATVTELSGEMESGNVTSEQLVQMYIDRISAYDKKKKLNSIISINPNALQEARTLDEERKAGNIRGPLHGIPVVVKDNFDLEGTATTAGSVSLANWTSEKDSFVVQKLKAAGAVVFAKANLSEFASSAVDSHSLLGGYTHNPYDITRSPAGSSGGTAVAVASNFAAIGFGTDTGGSIRNPSSWCNLYGIRPSKGLVSNSGIIPGAAYRDTAGPMARTAEDMAIGLEVIAGTDSEDDYTLEADADSLKGDGYTSSLSTDGLKGKRIGYLASSFSYMKYTGENDDGTKKYELREPDAKVSQMIQRTRADLRKAGATFVDMSDVLSDEYLDETFLSYFWGGLSFEPEYDTNRYLYSHGDNAPYKTLKELLATGTYGIDYTNLYYYPEDLGELADSFEETKSPYTENVNGYQRYKTWSKALTDRAALTEALDQKNVDAIMFIVELNVPMHDSEESTVNPQFNYLFNTFGSQYASTFSVFLGCPDMVLPMGFSETDESCPTAMPVGMHFVGRFGDEKTLMQIAYAYEQQAGPDIRRMPENTPALKDDNLNAFLESLMDEVYSIDYSVFGSKPEGKAKLMEKAYDRAAAVDLSDPYAVYEAAYELARAYDNTVAALKASGISLAKADVVLNKTQYTYTGNRIIPELTVTVGGVTLNQDQDYTVEYENNLNAGKAAVVVKGKGEFSGSRKESFQIKPAALSSASLSYTSAEYTGNALKPAATVKAELNGKTKKLKAGTDYTITYKKNRYVGKATATITGKGNYTGKLVRNFRINPKGTRVSTVTAAANAVTVKWKKQATQTNGYQIQYSTNKNFKSGNKTVTVKGNKTTSKKISKLKSAKTYYVRVRTYKTVSGKKYYSSWSKAKTVKTK